MTRLLRLTFVAYAIVLFVATHAPGVSIAGSGFRVDLLIHTGVFGLWNVLLMQTAWFGPRLTRRNLIASSLVAALAGIADELTQAFPIFDRTFGLDDMTANLTGVFAAWLLMWFIAAKSGSTEQETGPPKG